MIELTEVLFALNSREFNRGSTLKEKVLKGTEVTHGIIILKVLLKKLITRNSPSKPVIYVPLYS
jgi:hypothetical protein